MIKTAQLPTPLTFDWDKGNVSKNELKHKVTWIECEETFYNNSVIVYDGSHSEQEDKFRLLGKTKKERLLLVIFTIRNQKIRVISARDQDRKERKIYEQNK